MLIFINKTDMKKLNEIEFRQRVKEIYLEEKNKLKSKKLIKEGFNDTLLDYVQSALDFLGWVDPTPISDTINGFIYWNRGDRLFAYLTWISAFPYLGDIVAKPAVLALKRLKSSAKLGASADDILGVSDDVVKQMENALDAGDVEGFKTLIDDNGGVMKNIVENFDKSTIYGSIMDNLNQVKSVARRIPIVGGLVSTIDEWTDIFTKASKQIKTPKEISDYYDKALKMGIKPLNDIDKKLLTQELNELNRYRGFRDYEPQNPNWWNRYYDGALVKLYGNRNMRSLIERTKWYLGLLDWLDIGNFKGPKELEREIPNLEEKMEEYDQTELAKNLAAEDFSEEFSVFDKINKLIPQSFTSDSKMNNNTDPLNVLFSIVGL
jgi:hypothetical protein